MCVFTDIILIMKNRHHHPRRSFLRDGKQHKKLRLNFTLRGEKGKPVRIALCCAAGLVLLVLLAALLKPRTQLMNTPEIQRIRERGVLAVGVRDDMPLFAEGGEGFEIELAQKFAAYLLPDTAGDAAAKLITVNGQTAFGRHNRCRRCVDAARRKFKICLLLSVLYGYMLRAC